ncbi:hypothetical protein PWEIH_14891 [Listeria weihenstephanensis FSL R9-0317]|uniref:Ommochrome-binding protein-like n=1 Tax=Listeria weihenstephanensis TaxID=1006155 RepID=A0A1S7FVQ4_9LIST|nr:hypothetical protein [Listeria weihenstephanensis]AQY51480.1 hypothetical protein UE46_10825 [Listeria weihenstephanensis]EUJ35840.1 hypothetical protein PWEIH_14891 [Listeria weihenstephanensis FSL R9-0317]
MSIVKYMDIQNHDVYQMGATKDFIIINNGYTGIMIYDKELNIQKTMVIASELLISNIYSSLLNNFVVLLDAENEKLYVVNLMEETITSIDTNNKIFNDYYFVDSDRFSLRAGDKAYTFLYESVDVIDFTEVSRQFLLANYQDEEVICNEFGEIFYSIHGGANRLIKGVLGHDKIATVQDGNVMIYDEEQLFVYSDFILKRKQDVPPDYSYRKVVFLEDGSFIVLLNRKDNHLCSRLEKYD